MTTISEPFTVMTVSHEAATFGDVCVQPGPTATSAVVTQDSMSASLVEIGDDRAVKTRTWHTKLTLPFTCPVVYDATRDKYVGVSRKSAFFLSPEEDGNARRKTIQLPRVVSRILPRLNQEPVFLYRDGTYSTLTAASSGDDPSGEAAAAGEHIVHVEMGGSDTILTVTRLGNSYRCRLLQLNESIALLNEPLDSLLAARELRACCLMDGKPLVLTSDGVFTTVGKDGVLAEVGRLSEKVPGGAVSILTLDSQRVLATMEDGIFVWNLTLQTREVSRSAKVDQAKMAGKALYFLSSDLRLCCAPMTVGLTRLCRVVGLGATGSGSSPVKDDDGGDVQDLEEVSEERLVALVRRLLEGKSRERLDEVLRLPYSGDRLLSSLRRATSLDEARALIDHLLSSLESYSLADTVPLEKTLDWLCCVLDAHLPRLLLTDGQEVANLINRVREAMDGVRNLFADLDHVERYLILKRVGSLEFDCTSLYSIQMMEI